MDHDDLAYLRANHPTLRFLAAENLPLMASFFQTVFLKDNRRSIPFGELTSLLEDRLFGLRQSYGEEKYPRSAREYLEDWASSQASYLRKYYVPRSDEPECDLTPEVENALSWLRSLSQRKGFIGTESRLITMLETLKDLVQRTEPNAAYRIAALEKERAAIDAQIALAKTGIFDRLQATQIKERFFDLEETAQKLLGDFRQIESNFRELDRQTRELIAVSEKTKGKLLDEIFLDRDVIWDSDQGRSFRSFWEFLMAPSRQEEMEALLQMLYARPEITELKPGTFLANIKLFLIEAGEKVYGTSTSLTEQLRKFLDDKAYLESRRIMDLIKGIEKAAIESKGSLPKGNRFLEIDELAPSLQLALGRGLYVPSSNPRMSEAPLAEGQAEVSLAALHEQLYVDERRLRENLRQMMQTREQFTLKELLLAFPLEKGVAEAVAYLNLAGNAGTSAFEDDVLEIIVYETSSGQERTLKMPRIIFVRRP